MAVVRVRQLSLTLGWFTGLSLPPFGCLSSFDKPMAQQMRLVLRKSPISNSFLAISVQKCLFYPNITRAAIFWKFFILTNFHVKMNEFEILKIWLGADSGFVADGHEPDGGSVHGFLPVRVRDVEQEAPDTRGPVQHQYFRGAGRPAADHPQRWIFPPFLNSIQIKFAFQNSNSIWLDEKIMTWNTGLCPTGLLEEEINAEDNGATVKAKQFYRSCMNTSKWLVVRYTSLIDCDKRCFLHRRPPPFSPRPRLFLLLVARHFIDLLIDF